MLDKRSLVDQVYETMRNDILQLRFPLGSRINVNELQTKIGVSCTPIREAVNRLQLEGLISYKNNFGASVLSLDVHDVEEIQELAMTLHCAAIKLSLKRSDPEKTAEELEKYRKAFAVAKTAEEQVTSVHLLIGVFYHTCGNRRLDNTMISMQGLQLLLRYIYAAEGIHKEDDLRDFDNMIGCVRKGNADGVCESLRKTTDRMTPGILSYIARVEK
ncbi:MAG: GntR family transcriptional regulator [Sphaerochaeta sp.]|nr:GntR family transcriptional regulator [Sphaerochaeta sp.]